MYHIIITLILSIFLIFIIYKFYSKIDSIIKQYLPSQRVLDIKSNMENANRTIEEKQRENGNIDKEYAIFDSKINNIFQKINEIAFMPMEFIQKATGFILSNMGWNLGKSS